MIDVDEDSLSFRNRLGLALETLKLNDDPDPFKATRPRGLCGSVSTAVKLRCVLEGAQVGCSSSVIHCDQASSIMVELLVEENRGLQSGGYLESRCSLGEFDLNMYMNLIG